jgi:Na+/glutamate symporter
MSYFVWLIVGIILLTITAFVHKHTYEQDYVKVIGNKVSAPRYAVIAAIVVTFIPVVNLIVFIIGLIFYIGACPYDIVFYWDAKWYRCLEKWLTERI